MQKIGLDLASDIPDEVVEIPPLDPALPSPAEHRMQLTREQAVALLAEAGGDKDRARALARQRGFIW